MEYFAIDFETYYDKELSVTTLGPKAYMAHPDMDIYMVSIVGENGGFVGHPKDAPWEWLKEHEGQWGYVAHNRTFDKAAYDQLRADGMDLPEPVEWHCTADLAAYCGYPRSLAMASQTLLGVKPDKGTRTKMQGKRWGDLNEEEQQELLDYALDDSRLCLALWHKLKNRWPEEERKLSAHTTKMAHRGVAIDFDAVKEGKHKTQQAILENLDKIPWAEDASPVSPKQIEAQCRRQGIPIPVTTAKDSPDFLEWKEQYRGECPWIDAVAGHRSLNRLLRILEKFETNSVDGRLRYALKYGGAHTMRWSGDSGLNMQNLSRDPISGVNLRNMIVPAPGKKFVVCDYDQIEAIVLLWLAGDEEQLALIRGGMDPYEAHARLTMGYNDPRPLSEVDSGLRRLAKIRVLGLGFGCGAGKFQGIAKAWEGIELTSAEAKRTVDDYRRKNKKITDLWNSMDNAFKRSVNKDFTVTLPSGRQLIYWGVRRVMEERIRKDADGNEHKERSFAYRAKVTKRFGVAYKFYGGKLVENLVQATARDILGNAILKLEDAGFPVVMHIHDEVVCEVPLDTDNTMISEIMCDTPEWASTCPVTASAKDLMMYAKA